MNTVFFSNWTHPPESSVFEGAQSIRLSHCLPPPSCPWSPLSSPWIHILSETGSNWTETHSCAGAYFFHFKCVPKLNRALFCISIWIYRYKRSRVANRFKPGRSVAIFIGVFLGTLWTLGYLRVCRVYTRCSGLPEIWVTLYPMVVKTELGQVSYWKNVGYQLPDSGTRWALITSNSLPLW